MSRFANKVVLVTGATAGIGRAAALAFAREGAKLVVTGRNAQAGATLVEELKRLGAEAEFVAGDAAQEVVAKIWVDAALRRFGRLDVAVNNAGTEGQNGPIAQQTNENYDHIFDVNVRGVFFALKYQLPALQRAGGGAIVNISSVVGQVGMPGAALYVASKHAVNGLTRSVALEAAREGIRVNAVSPGAVQTEMFERFTGHDAGMQAGIAAAHPVGRVGHVDEIAGAILYLASDDAKFTTGQILPVDGGYSAQ